MDPRRQPTRPNEKRRSLTNEKADERVFRIGKPDRTVQANGPDLTGSAGGNGRLVHQGGEEAADAVHVGVEGIPSGGSIGPRPGDGNKQGGGCSQD